MMRRTRLLVVLVALATSGSARADQPTDAGQPPASEEPAPPATQPSPPTESAPPAPPVAAPALRPSPGPVTDPIPGSYPPLGGAGDRSHEPDFFLRLLIGPSSLSARTGKRSLTGGGINFGMAAGLSIRRDLILQLDFLSSYAGGPTYEEEDESVDRDFTVSTLAIGPGATYYLPYNTYATVAVYASWLVRTETREVPPPPTDPFGEPGTEEVESRSKAGIGTSLTVGKEWWITDRWGIGAAARAFLARMADADSEDSTWGVQSFALLLSATLN